MGKSYAWRIETAVSVRILDAVLTNSIMVQKNMQLLSF